MLEDFVRDERAAMPAGEDEAILHQALHVLGEIDHLGHVGEIVEREADRIGAEALELGEQIAMLENLQVDNPHVVAGRARRRRHPLHSERFEPQINLAVHKRTRMYE